MKYYILLSAVLIGLLVGVVYFQNSGDYLTISLFGVNLTFPSALWLLGGMGIIFLIGLIFLGTTTFKYNTYRKRVAKEIKQILNWGKELIFYRATKGDEPKKMKVLDQLKEFVGNIWGDKLTFQRWEKFPYMLDLKKIKEGEYVDLSKYKIPFENPWEVENGFNLLRKHPEKAGEILQKYKDEKLRQEAFKVFAKTAPISEILRFDYPVDVEIILKHIQDPKVGRLLARTKLTPQEQVEVARAIYTTRTPEEEMELLSPQPVGQVYLAFKYEHLEQGKKLAEEHNIHLFDFFVVMREKGIKVEIDQFLGSIWENRPTTHSHHGGEQTPSQKEPPISTPDSQSTSSTPSTSTEPTSQQIS
jgi:uncharacterized integral membrane protein